MKIKLPIKLPAKKRTVKEPKFYIPNTDTWRIITIVLLVMTLFWQLDLTVGWLNGTTLINHYGVDPILANAIAECPDMLFYSTYITGGIFLILLGVTAVLLFLYITDELEGTDVLNVTTICSMSSIWVFPIVHISADLAATGMKIRDTSNFDVFQLGIDGWPLVVITAVCAVVLWVNNRISTYVK